MRPGYQLCDCGWAPHHGVRYRSSIDADEVLVSFITAGRDTPWDEAELSFCRGVRGRPLSVE